MQTLQFDPMFASQYGYVVNDVERHYISVEVKIRHDGIRKLKSMKKTAEYDSVFVGMLMAMVNMTANGNDPLKMKFVKGNNSV